MTKLLIASAITLLALTPAAFAATPEDCTAMWKKADAKAEGKLSGDMAKPYMMAMDAMKMPAKMAKDGVVDGKEFMDACQKDAFKDVK